MDLSTCILLVLIVQTFTEVLSCPTSTATISYVSSCPTNQAEWEKAARLKNCKSIAVIQNCTTPAKFVYHCLMNQWRNATLEVCAPIFYLQGYCVEFNVHTKEVVENYDEGFECLKFNSSERCPPRYPSNEAYKYQACYSYKNDRISAGTTTMTIEKIRAQDNGVIGLIFILLALVTGGIIFLVLVVAKFRRNIYAKLFAEGGKTSNKPLKRDASGEKISLLEDKDQSANQVSEDTSRTLRHEDIHTVQNHDTSPLAERKEYTVTETDEEGKTSIPNPSTEDLSVASSSQTTDIPDDYEYSYSKLRLQMIQRDTPVVTSSTKSSTDDFTVVEKSNEKSNKAPPQPKDPTKLPSVTASSETDQEVADDKEKYQTCIASKHGKTRQAPPVPVGITDKSKN